MLGNLLERLKNRSRLDDPTEQEHLVALAAATLLIEVAWADHDISGSELEIVRATLTGHLGLAEAEVDEIVAESRLQHEQSVGFQRFTRTLTEAWDEAERFELVVQMWRLALADNRIDRFEEHVIRKIAELLYVDHSRFIEAKQRARAGR